MPASTKAEEREERKLSLPIGHSKAGYISPDLSFIDDRDPPVEEGIEEEKRPTREENIEAREAEAKAVAEAEDKAAKEERKAEAETAKAEAKSTSGSSTATS